MLALPLPALQFAFDCFPNEVRPVLILAQDDAEFEAFERECWGDPVSSTDRARGE